MGFRVGGNTARLEFGAGTILDGATVRVSLDMSVRDFLALQRSITGGDTSSPETFAQFEDTYRRFALSALKGWDLETEDGAPIPATVDGFMALPFAAANAIFTAWAQALGGPGPNSPTASANGAMSGADFERMVPA